MTQRSLNTIPAVPTYYHGIEFRSRMEARWAVLFDSLGIRWSYELRYFDTSTGGYLPDFWFPAINRWIEVKGPTPVPSALSAARCVAKESRTPMALVWGDLAAIRNHGSAAHRISERETVRLLSLRPVTGCVMIDAKGNIYWDFPVAYHLGQLDLEEFADSAEMANFYRFGS